MTFFDTTKTGCHYKLDTIQGKLTPFVGTTVKAALLEECYAAWHFLLRQAEDHNWRCLRGGQRSETSGTGAPGIL